MNEANELVVLEKKQARELFVQENGLIQVLEKVKIGLQSITPDTSTAKGREQIRSLAFRVTKSKTYIEAHGKEVSAELKELPKIVDANRKYAKEFLEKLADEIRKPLTDWEAEQEQIKAEEMAKEEALKLAQEIERLHELGLLMNKQFDIEQSEKARIAAEQAERARLEQIERERVIAKNAAKEARQAAELAARQEAERVANEAKAAREKADRERIEAQLRAEAAEKAKAEAEARHAAQLEQTKRNAELAKARAIEEEKSRVAAEAKRVADEQSRREADTKHKAAINRAAVSSLVVLGITEEQAKSVVRAIAKGEIKHVSIQY